MLKLKKYFKPYIFALLVAVALLFAQGMSDLYLPNLMSDIVNIGIQRNGIEHISPDAISIKGMDMMTASMTEDERKQFIESYKIINLSDKASAAYKEKYTEFSNGNNQSIYVIKDNINNREQLDEIFSTASLALMLNLQSLAGHLSGGQNTQSSDFNTDNINIQQLYTVTNFPFFTANTEKFITQAKDADKSIGEQVGAALTKLFYKELGTSLGNIQESYLFKIGTYMILVTLLGVVSSIFVSLIAAKVSAGTAQKLRRDLFAKVESFSNSEFDKFSTASLITRTTNDVTQVQNLIIMSIRLVLYAPIIGIGGIILATSTTMALSWVIIGAIGALLGTMLIILIIALPKFKSIQKLIDKLNLVTRESLSGILVIRAFGTEQYEENRFDKANKDLTSVNLFVNRTMTFLMPIMMLVMNAVSVLIVWVGSHLISSGEIQIGDMMAFIQYSMMIIISFLMIGVMFIIIPRASVSAKRISEVLESEISVKDCEAPETLPENVRGEITFNNVSFRYDNAENDVISDINFTAMPGQTTAFIGSTGSGKSTLISLIPRFYDVTKGSITIDGIDIRKITQHDLREQIGLVPQKGVLFSGDIASNLRYGKRNAKDEEVKTASHVAQADEFIASKKEKYKAPISQGGTNVSGGQKQRLAIARALVKKTPVYIFDDSFSALDFKTDAALRKALKSYTGSSTVIIVAQRINTIMHAEQIIVLDEGRIVGKGTHNELLKDCDTYREIAVSQNCAMEI